MEAALHDHLILFRISKVLRIAVSEVLHALQHTIRRKARASRPVILRLLLGCVSVSEPSITVFLEACLFAWSVFILHPF